MKEYILRENVLNKAFEPIETWITDEVVYVEDIKNIPAADVKEIVRDKWISIKDSLPNKNEEVLCYRGNHIGGLKDVYTYKDMDIWQDSYGYFQTTEDEGITHWMELPEDPIK